jgi:hypothetical protein
MYSSSKLRVEIQRTILTATFFGKPISKKFLKACMALSKQFFSAFAKLRKTAISFEKSVRLSVRPMEQRGSHWKDFHETL